MNEQVIDVNHIVKRVATNGSQKPLEILHGISLQANAGEFLSIVGPSGAGKSTLLSVVWSFQTNEWRGAFARNRSLSITCRQGC